MIGKLALLACLLSLPACGQAPAQAGALCVDGHPAKRSEHVSYAGLPVRSGYQRDHRVPLCLGGADTAANVRYQPLSEALRKDGVERRACELYCSGALSLEAARAMVAHY